MDDLLRPARGCILGAALGMVVVAVVLLMIVELF
jgi:hypothetical protein